MNNSFTITAMLEGLFAGTDYSDKESFVIRVVCWALQKAFTDSDIDAGAFVRDCLAPLLQSVGFELVGSSRGGAHA